MRTTRPRVRWPTVAMAGFWPGFQILRTEAERAFPEKSESPPMESEPERRLRMPSRKGAEVPEEKLFVAVRLPPLMERVPSVLEPRRMFGTVVSEVISVVPPTFRSPTGGEPMRA